MDEQVIKSILDRLDKQEKDITSLFERTSTSSERQAIIETKLDNMATAFSEVKDFMKEIRAEIKVITDRPAKRWDAFISSAISALVAGTIAFYMGRGK